MDLFTAAGKGDLKLVKWLLQEGADIDTKSNNRWTVLMYASQHGQLEVVKWLLEKGADINAKNDNRWTALIYASENGHLETVKWLLQEGADIDAKDYYRRTALMFACGNGHLEICKYLKSYIDKRRAEILSGQYRTEFPLEVSMNEFSEYKLSDFEIYNLK